MNSTAEPMNNMDAGTNAISALRSVMFTGWTPERGEQW
jgi:hypothetical protein